MGYLLFMDALGIQNYYNQGVRRADPIMNRIASLAKSVYGASIPDSKVSLKNIPGNKLVIMNDSVFMYSIKIEYLLYFSCKFMKSMFIPEKNVDPIAFRGAIAKTNSIPKIVLKESENMSLAKFVIDNISAAMIAEKKKILGPRVIIPKELIDEIELKRLDIKYQVLLMDLSKMESIKSDIFGDEFKNYYDIAWMIGYDSEQEKHIEKNIIEFWKLASLNSRSALHASAAMALFKAAKIKRKSIKTVISLLYNGQRKGGLFDSPLPRDSTYEDLLNFGQTIQKNREVIIAP
jgi:hypothetical protein